MVQKHNSVLKRIIIAENSLNRNIKIIVSAVNDRNDFRNRPIKLCTCDYYKDEHINIKDYIAMKRNANINLNDELAQFNNALNMSADDYESIILN